MRFFKFEIHLFVALMFSWVHGQDVQCPHVTLSENSGVFTSPNYPNEYNHKLSCSWTINASPNNFVRLTFVEFDMKSPFLKCVHDFVTVDNGTHVVQTYCNNRRPPQDAIMSEGNSMVVALKSDDFFRNGKGFKASYKIVDKDGNPLDKEDEEEVEDETGKAVAASTTTTLAKPVTTTMAPKAEKVVVKPRKSKKGKKGKKNRKSKEERRRERKLRRQRAKAEKRKNRKSRKGKGRKRGKKAKRGAAVEPSA